MWARREGWHLAFENNQGALTIGIDVGGSFTDVVMSDGAATWRAKAPTVPGSFSTGVIEGCEKVADQAGSSLNEILPRVARFGLGTTAVTNALTVHQGERVGLLTTKGFEHLALLARGERVARDGWLDMPWVPVDIRRIAGVAERLGRGGEVIEPLADEDVLKAVERLIEQEAITALAISFLWSFRNPIHEDQAVRLIAQRWPDLPVFAGANLQPVIREYERTMLAVMNAFCSRALSGIDDLDGQLRQRGLRVPMLLLQANGGATTLLGARLSPMSLAASGPAAGVAAAAEVAQASGYASAVCGDMGGTSFDVGIIVDGKPVRRQRGKIHGVKMAQAHVEVTSIGSGGGSIGWIDSRGLLRVGPQTARAYPGPACYGRGGSEPTVTDAMLLLGYLDGENFLGGAMVLDRAAAEAACASVGAKIGLSAIETAWGIRELALADMVNAVRAHVSTAGADPRALIGVTYGGSGSLFMAAICGAVGIDLLLAPELASVLSAYGAASADIRVEKIRSMDLVAPFQAGRVHEAMRQLENEVQALLAERDVRLEDRSIAFEGDFRFQRQAWEIPVEINGAFNEDSARASFVRSYGQLYGEASLTSGVPLELVALRAIGTGKTVRAQLPRRVEATQATPTPVGKRLLWIDRDKQEAISSYEVASLEPGSRVEGPALLDSIDNTLWVPAGGSATMDERRTIRVTLRGGGEA